MHHGLSGVGGLEALLFFFIFISFSVLVSPWAAGFGQSMAVGSTADEGGRRGLGNGPYLIETADGGRRPGATQWGGASVVLAHGRGYMSPNDTSSCRLPGGGPRGSVVPRHCPVSSHGRAHDAYRHDATSYVSWRNTPPVYAHSSHWGPVPSHGVKTLPIYHAAQAALPSLSPSAPRRASHPT